MDKYKFTHTIVLLTYRRPDLLEARFNELFNFYRKRRQVELLIIDNGSEGVATRLATDSCRMKNDEYARKHDSADSWFVTIRRIEKNIGFAHGMNHGLRHAFGKIIHLLSDDVRVYGDFITEMDHMLSVDSNTVYAAEIINWRAGWNVFGDQKINYPAGYYMAAHRDIWRLLDGLDERFVPYDYEDVDLGMKAQKAGVPLKAVPLPLEHAAAGTIGYNPQRMEHTIKQRAKFAEKWGLPNIPERP